MFLFSFILFRNQVYFLRVSTSDSVDAQKPSESLSRQTDDDIAEYGNDNSLGYTVAHYGDNGKPQTVSSRTFEDDGRGTVTSTYTSETRYSSSSPLRTFEYSKGTSSVLPDNSGRPVSSTYEEISSYESSRTSPKGTTTERISDVRSVVRSGDDRQRPPVTSLSREKEFVTDNRCYGFQEPAEKFAASGKHDESVDEASFGSKRHKFFGEDREFEKPENSNTTDVGMIRTTYERFSNDTRERLPEVEKNDTTRSSMASYTASEFDPSKIYSGESSRQETDLKDSVYSTSSFGTYDRRTSELDNSFENFPPPPPPSSSSQQGSSVVYKSDVKPPVELDSDGKKLSDHPRKNVGTQEEGKRETIPENESELLKSLEELETVGRDKAGVKPSESKDTDARGHGSSNETGDDRNEELFREPKDNYFRTVASYGGEEKPEVSKVETVEEFPLNTLCRDKEMSRTSLPTVSDQAARPNATDVVIEKSPAETRADGLKLTSKMSFELIEPEGNISSSVVEEALTPSTSRRADEKRKDELDDGFESDKRIPSVQLLEKVEQLPHSKPPSTATTPKVTPKTTPRLNLKFIKDTKEQKGAFDFGKSKFTSKHEVVRRGKEVEVKLESLKLGKEDNLRIVVIPPAKPNEERVEFEPKVKKSRHTYEISFRPTEVGTHKIMAYVNGIVHPLSPFPIRVYDASEIIVGAITPQSTTNDTVEFTVDAGRAGFGNLEMAIKDSEGVIIPSHVAQLETGTAKFLVTFNPTTAGMHTVNITFNKEVLKNSPFEVMIIEPKTEDEDAGPAGNKTKDTKKEEKKRIEKEKPKKEKEEKQDSAKKPKEKDSKKKKHVAEQKTTVSTIPSLSRMNKPAVIFVNVSGAEQLGVVVSGMNAKKPKLLYCTPKNPYKRPVECEVVDHENGVKKVIFTPTCVGDHEIDIKYGGVDVQGSPFTCRSYDPAKIAVGEIPNGIVDQTVHFIVDASDAGVGNLEVAINEGHIPSMAQSLGQHRYDISFVPREQIDHTISVRFNNEPVPGSPFICHVGSPHAITVSGPGLERVPVGQVSRFYLSVEGQDQTVEPVVLITDVHGEQVPAEIFYSEAEKKYVIEYVPKNIEIEYEGEPVSSSPFTSKAYDANCARLTCVEKAVVGKPCTFTIDAARAGAGNMEIIVSVENRNVPNFVQAEGQAKFKVSFTPQEPKEHIISVRFNGQPIPGSPMTCPVMEAPQQSSRLITNQVETPLSSTPTQQIKLIGDLSLAQVGQIKGFSIDTGGRDVDCLVVVTEPDGREVTTQVEKVLDGYHVQFLPLISGDHQINIEIDGRPLGICPVIMEVVHTPKVPRLPSTVLIGKKLAFEVDAGRSVQEDLIVKVRDEEGHELPVTTETDSRGIIRVNCRFRNKGRHTVELFLDGRLMSEPQYLNVIAPGTGARIINEIERGRVGEPFKVAIRVDTGVSKHCSIALTDPHGNQVPVSLRDIANDIIEAEFVPKTEGNHSLSIKVGDERIKGSPFRVAVLDLSTVRVIGLKNDRIGLEQRFNVDWSNSGGSEASVRITRDDSEIPCAVKKVKPGLYVCSFTPKQAGLHLVDVKIDGILLPECPYECIINDTGAVRARGDALTRAQRGKTARFEVSLSNAVRGELDVIITGRSSKVLELLRTESSMYFISFEFNLFFNYRLHKIEVLFADVPIAGSPFKCEVVDPRKVIIKGMQESFVLHQPANISGFQVAVSRAEAGNGELQVDVTDPSGQLMKADVLKSPNGTEQISFLPTEVGKYKLNARLAGFQVAGTPQNIIVEEQGKPSVGGNAIERVVDVNQQASVIFDSKKIKGGLKIDVRGPKKSKVRHTANKRSDGTTEILFTPTEVGQYLVNVEFNNKSITGSPFSVEVVDSHKVIIDDENVDDNNLLHLAVQQRNVINVDATAAGKGDLRVEVCNAEGDFVDGCSVESLGYGKYRILFNPRIVGEYKIFLYWSEIPVDSAYPLQAVAESDEPSTSHGFASSNAEVVRHLATSKRVCCSEKEQTYEENEMADMGRIVLRGEGLTRAFTKEKAEFIIDTSDVSREGRITCALTGQKADVPIRLVHLGNNVYKATYTPLIPGSYELQVLWNSHNVNGSPFLVHVDHNISAAELIHVDTNTLKIGIINEDIKTLIDTRRAGPGQLSAQCMGPSKLAYCELYDHRDGTYTLSVRPSEIGKHTLVVKYSNEHVPGSPFVINVSHPPDASKVRVFGPGIEHGILSTFKSNFVVETKGAGAGQLTVRVRGPKGAFNVEMQREKKQERTIHCKYEPKEPGDYQVEVKWHGEHVPGSPFLVMIMDTEQELERFLRGSAPSPQPATPFIPPGWIGTPPPPLFMSGPPAPPHGPYPPPHLALPPPHGMVPYGPSPPHAMRTGARTRYANGY
ncbi:unnamed protein product [Enterobius vermicularis]|uniref:Uncharacterized protein n=1 Tax=Enterobius vermicularis TaxID=51028 RepID=A0A3P6I760_ENTVE|nr:unnamed protein product [Enterobius vermicularis]